MAFASSDDEKLPPQEVRRRVSRGKPRRNRIVPIGTIDEACGCISCRVAYYDVYPVDRHGFAMYSPFCHSTFFSCINKGARPSE